MVETARAMDADAPQLHEGAPQNVCYDWGIGDREATEAALAAPTAR